MDATLAEDCAFCKIIADEAPAAIIHEDEHLIAFMNLYPASEGHSLIVSKGHYKDIFGVPASVLRNIATFTQRLAQAKVAALGADGVGVAQFNGAAAGQTVFHYHVHVVPRWSDRPSDFHGRERADMEQLHELARRIAATL